MRGTSCILESYNMHSSFIVICTKVLHCTHESLHQKTLQKLENSWCTRVHSWALEFVWILHSSYGSALSWVSVRSRLEILKFYCALEFGMEYSSLPDAEEKWIYVINPNMLKRYLIIMVTLVTILKNHLTFISSVKQEIKCLGWIFKFGGDSRHSSSLKGWDPESINTVFGQWFNTFIVLVFDILVQKEQWSEE